MLSMLRQACTRMSAVEIARPLVRASSSQPSYKAITSSSNPTVLGKEYAVSQRILKNIQSGPKKVESEKKIPSSWAPLDTLDKAGMEKLEKGVKEIEEFNRSIQNKG